MNEVKKLTDIEYFESKGLSNSFLNLFDRSPIHAQVGLKKTSAMNDGTICHKYILEPNNFWNKYYFIPESIKSKASKEYKELNAKIKDKELLKYNYKNILESISKNINAYELIDGLSFEYILDNSEKEIAVFWEDEILGEIVQKKAKLDILYRAEKYNIIIDIKKTENCLDFHYSVKRYNLYRQAAFYSDGIESLFNKPTIFIFLTFEFEEPFGVKAYQLCEDYIQHGRTVNFASAVNWIKWKNEGFPQKIYKSGIEQIPVPAYL